MCRKSHRRHHGRSISHSNKKRHRPKYDDGSSGESSDERHRRRRKAQKTIFLTRNQQVPLRTAIQGKSKKDVKKKIKDRFYDRSLLVPNDIYFGDTQVPLHVLHSYNSDAVSSSSESEAGWFNKSNKNQAKSISFAKPTYKVVYK